MSTVSRAKIGVNVGGVALIAERVAPKRGGLAVATARIARHASSSGERVHVIYPSREAAGGARGKKVIDGVVYHPVGALSKEDETLMAWSQHAEDVIRSEKLDLVQGVYATRAGYLAALLGRRLRLPSIVSLRGNDLDRGLFRAQDLPFLERALTGATAVTGVSRALCETAERLFDVKARHITNSVDAETFRPEAKDNSLVASLGLVKGRTLGFLGELREKKGMRFLLPAFDVVSRQADATLLLIGGVREDAREAFEHFARVAPEAFDRIRVVEYDRDPNRLNRLLALCDLMVFPSLQDGTPNAVLEAMACGRPILATDAGGQRDLIQNGETGGLLPVGKIDLLPEAIEELLALPAERLEAMGKAARSHVLEHHRPEQERDAYRALYAELRSRVLA